MAKEPLSLLVAAGGTGGHLFPAIAVLEQLSELLDGKMKVCFVGNPSKIEARVVPTLGYEFVPLPITGFSGIFSLQTLKLPFLIQKSGSICKKIIKRNAVDLILCTGAYLSYPAGVAAKKTRKPLMLMESNVSPGKSNSMLSRKADAIVTSFEESKAHFPQELRNRIHCFGNPVRSGFSAMPIRAAAAAEFGLKDNKKTLLVFGGSLGAKSINNGVMNIVESLIQHDYQLIWQTGEKFDMDMVDSRIREHKSVKILKFIDNMPAAYAAADLVVSRSGATTVAELCAAAKPSILVPLQTASNNEQEENAYALLDAGAAIIINDDALEDDLQRVIFELFADNESLKKMSHSAATLAKPDAAKKAAELAIILANKSL